MTTPDPLVAAKPYTCSNGLATGTRRPKALFGHAVERGRTGNCTSLDGPRRALHGHWTGGGMGARARRRGRMEPPGRRPAIGGSVSYTGDVEVGGPPDVRELPGLTITKLAVGP